MFIEVTQRSFGPVSINANNIIKIITKKDHTQIIFVDSQYTLNTEESREEILEKIRLTGGEVENTGKSIYETMD